MQYHLFLYHLFLNVSSKGSIPARGIFIQKALADKILHPPDRIKNVHWHILAPSAVACDILHLRASALPPEGFCNIGNKVYRVGQRATCPLSPHQTVREVLPHTAFRHSSFYSITSCIFHGHAALYVMGWSAQISSALSQITDSLFYFFPDILLISEGQYVYAVYSTVEAKTAAEFPSDQSCIHPRRPHLTMTPLPLAASFPLPGGSGTFTL